MGAGIVVDDGRLAQEGHDRLSLSPTGGVVGRDHTLVDTSDDFGPDLDGRRRTVRRGGGTVIRRWIAKETSPMSRSSGWRAGALQERLGESR